MEQNRRKQHMDGIWALLLFGVFAVCILSVLLMGVRVYRGMADRDQASYDQRTCVQYVATKLRQVPAPEAVWVETFEETSTLCIAEEVEGEIYLTRVYCWDGAIRELYCREDAGLLPQDGETILPAQSMSFSMEDGLLRVEVIGSEGDAAVCMLAVRGRGEAVR